MGRIERRASSLFGSRDGLDGAEREVRRDRLGTATTSVRGPVGAYQE